MPSARDWILVLYGCFVRTPERQARRGTDPKAGGWVAAAHLVALLESLDTDAASTRTALHRMKRAGFLAAESRDGAAGYRLTAAGQEFFADGDRRVLERETGERGDEGSWVLASFSVPESQRRMRYRIRARLLDLGFGQESAGLLIAPVGLLAEAERVLEREGFDERVSLWVGRYGGPGDLAEVIRRAWDVDGLSRRYDTYLAGSSQLLDVEPVGDRRLAPAAVRYFDAVGAATSKAAA